MPSREEAFGSTILDALALGVPVIGAHVGGIPEALVHGGGVTFPVGDSAALAAEMAALAKDPRRRAQLAAKAREAAGHFDLSGMVDRTLAVYRSAMEDVERQ
jgi:glycosyltransferase involved in cell wall biosynthesis